MSDKFPCFGCLPTTPLAAERRRVQDENAVPVSYLWEKCGAMPIIRWDTDLEGWLDRRADEADELRERGVCTLPWVVLQSLPKERKRSDALYFSQGPVNSCMAHSDAFAFHSTLLSALIAKGAPLDYRPVNPFCGYWKASPGDWGGRTVTDMAATSNEYGHLPIDLVGDDNTSLPTGFKEYAEEAANFQSGISYLAGSGDQLVENIVRCCRADMAVSFGNSTAVRSSKIDKNGVNVAVLGGYWAHATSFCGYRKVGKTVYLFWVNSHGPIYGGSTEGDPADGCWMDLDTAARFCGSIGRYGAPYLHFVEGSIRSDWTLRPTLRLDFPNGFKR